MKDGHFSSQTKLPKLKSESLQKIVVFHFFQHIFFEFGFLDFRLDSIEFFKCMTWQSIFLFVHFFFFILMIHLLRATSHVVGGLPTWSTSSHVRIVLKRGRLLVQNVVHVICPKERVWLRSVLFMSARKGLWFKGLLIPLLLAKEGYDSKGSREMGIFWSTCSKVSIKVISEYYGFGTCIFWSLKGFGRLEAIARLDAYHKTIWGCLQHVLVSLQKCPG